MRILLFLVLLFTAEIAVGGPAVIYNGDFVKALKSNLKLKDEARVITGSSDPTSVAVDAEAGSLYIRSNGSVYIKKDAGSSTNWEEIPGLPITLTTDVTGVLPVANGGTNASTALNGNRLIYSSGGGLVEYSGITANRAVATGGTGLPVASATTDTELGYLSGTTSSVQTQLNGKLENVVEDLSPQLGANLSLNDGSSTYSITDGSETVFRVNSGTNSVAVGQNAGAGTLGDGVAGLGHESCSNAGSNSTCMGNESGPETSGDANFVAIGQLSKADDNSVSIGNFTQADGERATAVGRSASAQANDSISLGAFATNTSQPNRLQIGAPSGSFAAITEAQMGNVSASFGLAPNATSDAVESGTLTIKASDKTNAGATGDAGDLILLPGKNSGSGADGEVIIDGLNWPTADGSADSVLTTDGAGQLSFEPINFSPDVEYAATSGTWDADSSTTVYGSSGQAIGGTLTTNRTKTITWSSTINATDRIQLWLSKDQVQWYPAGEAAIGPSNIPVVVSLSSGGNVDAGVYMQSSGTQTLVRFRQYMAQANDDSPAINWPASDAYWVVTKASEGSVVGFGGATATDPGLVTYSATTCDATVNICSSTYTPTRTNVSSNCTTENAKKGTYTKIGNIVEMAVNIVLDHTDTSNCNFDVGIPIASNFTVGEDATCVSEGSFGNTSNSECRCATNFTDDEINCACDVTATGLNRHQIKCQYEIK